MRIRIFFIIGAMTGFTARSQELKAPPSKEAFVNAVFRTIVDSSYPAYFLIGRTDTCRFLKYDYEYWAQYVLKEPVSIVILNALSAKVFQAQNEVYFWQPGQLQKAICINRKTADSLLNFAGDLLEDHSLTPRQLDRAVRKRREEWQHLPAQEKIIYSFSQPFFTDDGEYAVIDLNFVCGETCGEGFTCVFRRTVSGWKLIAKFTNWSA